VFANAEPRPAPAGARSWDVPSRNRDCAVHSASGAAIESVAFRRANRPLGPADAIRGRASHAVASHEPQALLFCAAAGALYERLSAQNPATRELALALTAEER
jgi:hypothetical protein